jgi:hypothetical protein
MHDIVIGIFINRFEFGVLVVPQICAFQELGYEIHVINRDFMEGTQNGERCGLLPNL